MIIFDFDQTLVDTSPVEHLRAARNWKAVMAQAPKLPVYGGITELLKELHAAGQTIAIVTKSPDMVPRAFIKEHAWPIEIVVGYHDVKNRKPHPEGLLLAMSKVGAKPEILFTLAIRRRTPRPRGEPASSRWARHGAPSTCQLWKLRNQDAIFSSVDELRDYLKKKLA
ncbi:HAD hydrolase-like protein [Mesorhizobium huakuii]|uniref:phosphoglycolate phosphatase n=1 Tax=Mesorhizobium huakuii TaxID=28104 RepID=A0ABZ0VMC5_9HYPH|nr:HAD hydrolase-like protein [Mesorhizobium huakuii]WQB97469.1 HAD hydrolase-like protein [Mesorhizobium huakuii]